VQKSNIYFYMTPNCAIFYRIELDLPLKYQLYQVASFLKHQLACPVDANGLPVGIEKSDEYKNANEKH